MALQQSPRVDAIKANCAAVGRYAANRLVLPAIAVLLFTLVFASPLEDWAEGKKHVSGAWTDAVAAAGGLLGNPVIRLLLFLLALFFFGRGARDVIRADGERAEKIETERKQLIAEQQRRSDAEINEIKLTVAQAHAVTRLIAQEYLLHQRISAHADLANKASTSVNTYGATLYRIEQGDFGSRGARGVPYDLDNAIRPVCEAFAWANPAILGRPWANPFPNQMPQPVITRLPEGGNTFDLGDNKAYFDAHKDYIRQLQQTATEYHGKVDGLRTEAAQLRSQINEEAGKLVGQ